MKVSEIIRKISESRNNEEIMVYENLLSFSFAFPVLLFGSFANFVGRSLPLGHTTADILIDSAWLAAMAVLFWLTKTYVSVPIRQANLFITYYVMIYLIILFRMFYLVGHGIWSLATILIMMSILHVRRTMLTVIAFMTALSGVYIWMVQPEFILDQAYYVTLVTALIIAFFVGRTVHKIIRNRFDSMHLQYEQIIRSEELLRQTLISVGDGVITLSEKGAVDFMNPIAGDLIGTSEAEAKGKLLSDVLTIKDVDLKSVDKEALFLDKNVVNLDMDTVLVSNDGSHMNIEMSVAPIRTKGREIVGYVLVFRDVSEKSREHREIEFLSYHDQLTGLYNRRYYDEEKLRIDSQENLPISVVYADINGLKAVNDTQGHEQGDLLIKTVSDVLKRDLDEAHTLARIGGDEFVILMKNTDRDEVAVYLQKVKASLAMDHTCIDPLSVAFGTGIKYDESEDLMLVLKEAEDIMYENKEAASDNRGPRKAGRIEALDL